MIQVVKQDEQERVAMYMKYSQKELASMLAERDKYDFPQGCKETSDNSNGGIFYTASYTPDEEQHDWEALRNQAAIAAMQAIIANEDYREKLLNSSFAIAHDSVIFANALIEALKTEKED